MQFHYGAVPENPDFLPEVDGWLAIREPGTWMMQLLALPVAFVLLFLSVGLLYLTVPRELLVHRPSDFSLSIGLLTAIVILLIPVHELLHAVCHPGWGFSSNSVIGLWLSKALFYAHYEGSMSRNRFLLVFAMPYIVLCLLPILILAVSNVFGWPLVMVLLLAYLSITGGMLACGDLIGFLLVVSQIPSSAIVRNKGWKTYWKPGVSYEKISQ